MRTLRQAAGRQRGRRAEAWAEKALRGRGLSLVARNYCCRLGELDLVMLDHEVLVVIEVRARQRRDYGGALGSVDRHKRRRIRRATLHFLQMHPRYQQHAIRFDVVTLCGSGRQQTTRWIRGAFDADE